MQSRHTLFLVPDLIGKPGGIARVCALVCRALTEAEECFATIALHDQDAARAVAARRFPAMHYVPCRDSRITFAWRAVLLALRTKPSVVFAAHPNFSYIACFLARLCGARSVLMIHGIDAWKTLSPLRRWGLRRADIVISVSRFTANQAVKANGISSERIRILHNCLDPDLIPVKSSNGSHAVSSLLTVARITLAERKGHDQVISALPELLKRFPELKYSIVGDGDGRRQLELLAARKGVGDAVRFHGAVSEKDLMRHYAEASLFIMPSRGEGFGLAFIEAMAQGTPAIGGNVDAAPEVILDGETGYVIDPGSTAEIVDRISQLLCDRSLREQMGRKAALHVQENFSYERFKKGLLGYLFQVS